MELQALSMGTTKRVGIYGATRVMLTIYVYMPTIFFLMKGRNNRFQFIPKNGNPNMAWGHPIREAEPLWAASRNIGLAGPGNGLADRLSAQSRASGNTRRIPSAAINSIIVTSSRFPSSTCWTIF